MGWIRKLLGASSKEELEGVHLDYNRQYWEVAGPKAFTVLFAALEGWLPENSFLYFEDGCLDEELKEFMRQYSVPEQIHIAYGTIWPRPEVFHVPATKEALETLTKIMEHHAEPELAVHFHVYQNDGVLIEWHDAFDGGMLLSGDFHEEKVKEFTQKLGTQYKMVEPRRHDPPRTGGRP
jgi:hypothetical protein